MVSGRTWAQAEHEAFLVAEEACRPTPTRDTGHPCGGKDALLIGAGIVNLVTALALVEQGWAVAVYDRLPDPLTSGLGTPASGGATFGGKDARIFSFNESRHHLARNPAIVAGGGNQFRHPISRDGWLSVGRDQMEADDLAWICELEGVPAWAAMTYGNDILRFNIDSHAKWQKMFNLYPELLRDTGYVGRLLRVYQTEESFGAAVRSEAQLGALIGVVGLDTLATEEPALADAVRGGALAGALRVQGFSLGVKTLARNMISLLASKGVTFHWEHELREVLYGSDGTATGLMLNGSCQSASHYVVSPGAYGGAIKGRDGTIGQVGAMVGMWMTLPNDVAPLGSPLKIRRRGFGSREAAEGANIIPGSDESGRPVLHCSSGHGFLGVRPERVGSTDLRELARCISDTVAELFGDKVRQAEESGLDGSEPMFCVRPWTPSGLGLLDLHPARDGGVLVLSGGHNTGGFAQAPAVAEAVVSTLDGRSHPMQTLYHPDRYRSVFTLSA